MVERRSRNHLPDNVKRYFAKNNIRFYIINATEIASKIGLGNRTNTILQSAFFKISERDTVRPSGGADEEIYRYLVRTKREEVVKMNYAPLTKVVT